MAQKEEGVSEFRGPKSQPPSEPKQVQFNPLPGPEIGEMYKRFVLDCISDLGYAVSVDFSQKPHLYVKIDDIADKISQLQSSIGYVAELPNKETRARLYQPIFGSWDADRTTKDNSTFKMLRMKLFEAAASYAENAQPFRFAALRIDVINAVAAPRDHFEGLNGSSLVQTNKRIQDIFKICTEIITHQQIMGRFGIHEKIDDAAWPLSKPNSNGSKLVYEISSNLKGIAGGIIERAEFVRMQRIAQSGSKALQMLLDDDFDAIPDKFKEGDPQVDKLNEFIGNLYAWGRDLGLIGSNRNFQSVSQKS